MDTKNEGNPPTAASNARGAQNNSAAQDNGQQPGQDQRHQNNNSLNQNGQHGHQTAKQGASGNAN